jgi:quinolinate synthase
MIEGRELEENNKDELVKNILELKKQRNATIVAHNYQADECRK